jgi:hypothetical protein
MAAVEVIPRKQVVMAKLAPPGVAAPQAAQQVAQDNQDQQEPPDQPDNQDQQEPPDQPDNQDQQEPPDQPDNQDQQEPPDHKVPLSAVILILHI